jgi:hypothetical protein
MIGLLVFTWGAWPVGKSLSVLMVQPGEMALFPAVQSQVDDQGSASHTSNTVPAILEARKLILETSSFLRPGDPGKVGLDFVVDPDIHFAANLDGLSNIFNTHLVLAEARLEMGGVLVEPSGTLSRPLAAGQTVSFQWDLLIEKAQVYEGTVWFYLRYMPMDGSPSSKWPLMAQRIELSSLSLWGLSGRLMRLLGGMGASLGLLLVSDGLVGVLTRWLL